MITTTAGNLCPEAHQLIQQYGHGHMTTPAFEAHVKNCPDCRKLANK